MARVSVILALSLVTAISAYPQYPQRPGFAVPSPLEALERNLVDKSEQELLNDYVRANQLAGRQASALNQLIAETAKDVMAGRDLNTSKFEKKMKQWEARSAAESKAAYKGIDLIMATDSFLSYTSNNPTAQSLLRRQFFGNEAEILVDTFRHEFRTSLKLRESVDRMVPLLGARSIVLNSIRAGRCAEPKGTDCWLDAYESLSRWKGMFIEIVAPRKPNWVLQQTQDAEVGEALTSAVAPLASRGVFTPEETRAMMERMNARSLLTAQRGQAGQAATALANRLRPGEAFLDLYELRDVRNDRVTTSGYLGFLIKSAGPAEVLHLGDSAKIDGIVTSFVDQVNRGGSFASEWSRLRSDIVGPLLSRIPADATRLWLSPDGELHNVPFHGLLAEALPKLDVTVVPAPLQLAMLRSPGKEKVTQAPNLGKRFLLAGDPDYGGDTGPFRPLPHFRTELGTVEDLAKRKGFPTKVLAGKNLKKAALLGELRETGYAHFATHGYTLDPRTSGFQKSGFSFRNAGLALAGANDPTDAEGRLTASDLLSADLSKCSLIAVSACDSGRGQLARGQGVLGFQASLFASGARSVLLSLWKVADEPTAILMEEFYRKHLVDGVSKSRALAEAQRTVATTEGGKFKDPRYWAAWVIAGEGW